MAFQLKVNEPVSQGVTRNVRRQLEKVIEYCGIRGNQHAVSVSLSDSVFEARKCFKRVRAALRLVREELGDDLYHEENFRFRDAARPLTAVRDAHVLVETVDKLKQLLPKTLDAGVLVKIREALLANQRKVTDGVLEENKAFATAKNAATSALVRLPAWKLTRDGWAAIETGLRRVYRTGHRALALAVENPTVEDLHEWRKQSKYLWHQLQLLETALPDQEKNLIDRTHKLATLLGEDHDLAVLRAALAADPLAFGGHRVLKELFVVIDRRRRELEREAFALGRTIYKDPPKLFISRIEPSTACEAVE